jgi:hypothetical protein
VPYVTADGVERTLAEWERKWDEEAQLPFEEKWARAQQPKTDAERAELDAEHAAYLASPRYQAEMDYVASGAWRADERAERERQFARRQKASRARPRTRARARGAGRPAARRARAASCGGDSGDCSDLDGEPPLARPSRALRPARIRGPPLLLRSETGARSAHACAPRRNPAKGRSRTMSQEYVDERRRRRAERRKRQYRRAGRREDAKPYPRRKARRGRLDKPNIVLDEPLPRRGADGRH